MGYTPETFRRRGFIEAEAFFGFYDERRKWAGTWMLRPEVSPDGLSFSGGGQNGEQGRNRKSSFKGRFDSDRWCEYIGLTKLQYETLERRRREFHKGNTAWIRDDLAETVLTNLGRPDLYAIWYPLVDADESLQDCA